MRETINAPATDETAKYKYQGKERDAETGYDYFEARLYDSALGRFMQVDPLAEKGPMHTPYANGFNNPLQYTDSDGKWPTWIHNWILRSAFKDILSDRQIKILERASVDVDRYQEPEESYMHAMSEPGQGFEEAENLMSNFIDSKMLEFIESDGDDALFALGEALHPIMDGTSPSHANFAEWAGDGGWDYFNELFHPDGLQAKVNAVGHFIQESIISGDQLQESVKRVLTLFKKFQNAKSFVSNQRISKNGGFFKSDNSTGNEEGSSAIKKKARQSGSLFDEMDSFWTRLREGNKD